MRMISTMSSTIKLLSVLVCACCIFGCSEKAPTVSTNSNEIEAFLAENPELDISMEELDAQPEPGAGAEDE